MSSNHTYVSQREWQAMQQRVGCVDAYVISREEEARRLQAEAERMRREIQQMQTMNRQTVDQAVQNMANSYRNALQGTKTGWNSQLTSEEADFRDQIQSMVNRVRNVSGHLNLADTRIENLSQQYAQAFQNLAARRTQGKERALLVQQEMDSLLNRIRALNPERFLPVQYSALETMNASLAANIRTGDYQAASVVAQNGILSASRMLTQLILLNEEYSRQLFRTQNAAAELEARINSLASDSGVLRAEMNAEMQEYEYDIAYWSRGRFDSICQQLSHIQTGIRSGRMSTQDLVQAEASIHQLEEQLTECDQEARNNLAGSVFVEDTAVRLYNTLTQSGWSLTESGFHQDDGRNPYTMQYDDGFGSNVSVVVSRGANATEPVYSIEVFGIDEYRATEIKEGVHAAVRREGLEVRGIERRNDCHLNPTPQAFITNTVNGAIQRTAARHTTQQAVNRSSGTRDRF